MVSLLLNVEFIPGNKAMKVAWYEKQGETRDVLIDGEMPVPIHA